jgi:hypothetical protein
MNQNHGKFPTLSTIELSSKNWVECFFTGLELWWKFKLQIAVSSVGSKIIGVFCSLSCKKVYIAYAYLCVYQPIAIYISTYRSTFLAWQSSPLTIWRYPLGSKEGISLIHSNLLKQKRFSITRIKPLSLGKLILEIHFECKEIEEVWRLFTWRS